MTKKHSKGVDLGEVLNPDTMDRALSKMKGSLDVYGRLAEAEVSQEQGMFILQNLASAKVFSEKVREEIAKLWNNPSYEEDKGRNLYNLNNAVTQHLTHEVSGERYEYANRVTSNVLKRLSKAAQNKSVLKKLWTPAKGDVIVTSE